MVKIEPIKSIRQRMQLAQQNEKRAQRYVELGHTCMKQAIEQDMCSASVQRAMDFYSLAMDKHPESPQPYLAMAYLSWKLREPDAALRFLEHVLSQYPEHVQAHQLKELL